jgi:hypothetical protein
MFLDSFTHVSESRRFLPYQHGWIFHTFIRGRSKPGEMINVCIRSGNVNEHSSSQKVTVVFGRLHVGRHANVVEVHWAAYDVETSRRDSIWGLLISSAKVVLPHFHDQPLQEMCANNH